MAFRLALVGALLLSGPATAALTTGDNLRQLLHDAETRDYNVYAPAAYDGLSPTPLIVDLHGASSNKEQQKGLSGWAAKADALGLLVAYPDGLGNTWNAGVCCDPAAANNEDDVGFIRAMVIAIQAEANVDTSRIYVTGLSNGGALTQRLACEAADVFAAAAPLAFPTPYNDFATECLPSQRMPVLSFMGLTDIVVPYTGGAFGGALESLTSWRAKNSCGPEPMEVHIDIGGSFCDVDTSCASSTEVGLCSVQGSSFDPPGDVFNGHILYLNDDGIVLVDLIWQFFVTGTVSEPVPDVPLAGPAALFALASGVAGAGVLGARRRARDR